MPLFVQRTKDVKHVKKVPVSRVENEQAKGSAYLSEDDDSMFKLPYPYASPAVITNYDHVKHTYTLELNILRVEESINTYTIADLPADLIVDKKDLDETECTLRFVINEDHARLYVNFQYEQKLYFGNRRILGTIKDMVMDNEGGIITSNLIVGFDTLEEATNVLSIDDVVYWVRNQDATRESIAESYDLLTQRQLELPLRVMGVTNRYDTVVSVGNVMQFPSIMSGHAYLIVQPSFYDTHWMAGDHVYALLTRVDDDDGLHITEKYEITYHHEDVCTKRSETKRAVFYVGMYTREYDDPYFKMCGVILTPLIEQSIRVIKDH